MTKSAKLGYFTVHKSASMLHYKLLLKACDLKSFPFYSPNNSIASASLLPFNDTKDMMSKEDSDAYNSIQAGCIGPIRRPLAIMLNHPVTVILRHPFDGLTSMYHSFTKIHSGIPDRVRQARLSKGIDRCVLEFSKDYLKRYKAYCDYYLPSDYVTFLKYEDMFANPSKWISAFLSPFSLDELNKQDLINYFLAETHVDSAKEGTHKNKMIPNQYQASLARQTIKELHSEWHQILDRLEYDISI